jgi:AraC-like DNA-binding protein
VRYAQKRAAGRSEVAGKVEPPAAHPDQGAAFMLKDRLLHPYQTMSFEFSDERPVLLRRAVHDISDTPIYDMHFAFELGLVLRGRMVREWQRTKLDVGPGEVWLTGIWEPHGFYLKEAPCEVLVFIISPMFLSTADRPYYEWTEGFMLPPRNRPQVPARLRPEVLAAARRLLSVQSRAETVKRQWIQNTMFEILLCLSESRTRKSRRPAAPVHTIQRLKPAIVRVFESRRYYPTATAARECGMSPTVFAAEFKRMMGLSFSQFALRFRLDSAARHLIRTEEPLKAVSMEWGFTDPSHFIKQFSKHYGVSPRNYRRRKRAVWTGDAFEKQ